MGELAVSDLSGQSGLRGVRLCETEMETDRSMTQAIVAVEPTNKGTTPLVRPSGQSLSVRDGQPKSAEMAKSPSLPLLVRGRAGKGVKRR